MDLMRTDFNWQPIELIENWESLIWTERYRECGEFQLVTYDIERARKALPLRNLVAVDESQEIMMIERHAIAEDDDGKAVLTVSGRSWDAFTKFRYAWKTFKQADMTTQTGIWDINNMTSAACVAYLLNYILVNVSAWDAQYQPGRAIEKLTIQNTANVAMSARNRRIDNADLYTVIMKILAEDDLGIRNLRPVGTQTNLTMQIRNGLNRTATVMFDVNAGHFTKVNYLFSSEDYISTVHGLAKGIKTVAYNIYPFENHPGGAGSDHGYRETVIYRDDYEVSNDSGPFVSMLNAQIATEARERDLVQMFDGEVSPDIPFEYNVDYFLGDQVLCVGNYGISQNLKVSEYIRAEDAGGYKGYPTLSQIGA